MIILMKETRRVSEDGFTIRRLLKDVAYDVADTAARYLIRSGYAEEVTEREEAVESPHAYVSPSELLFQALKPPTREEMEGFLRPVPTNPATTRTTAVRCGDAVQLIEHAEKGDAA